jgi:glycosyltransferase involved in cell wall biosynthesis
MKPSDAGFLQKPRVNYYEMQLSLVICTRNRAAQLPQSLESLTRLRYPVPWELVIVDNGSEDETQEVLRNYDKGLLLKIVIEPQAGLGKAHNRGWSVSQGDIIAFTDDDCYPTDDFLSSVARCFEEDHRLGFIGGRILLHDPKDYRITIQEKSDRQDFRPGDFLPTGLIQGANFACRRTALESVNGFDERFGPGAVFNCEEVDVMARMLARGWHGAYDPRPLVYHHHRRRTELEASRLIRQYDRGRGAYYSKCILNPKLRTVYLRNWYREICRQGRRTTARELAAAAEFLVRDAVARLNPIRSWVLSRRGKL